MEIVSRHEILKFLHITLLSYSRICYFSPVKESNVRIKSRFLQISSQSIHMRLADIPVDVEGYLVFYSYTFIFRFRTQLRVGTGDKVFNCDIPTMIETFDRRKYARLKFESSENKIVTIHNKSLNKSMKGILTDISAGGLGFSVVDIKEIPKIGDIIMTEVKLRERTFQVMAEVIQVRDDFAGCSFLEKAIKFQLELNEIVKQEIEWRSELMLKNLRKREELMNSYRQRLEKTAKNRHEQSDKLSKLEPFSDFFITSIQAVTGISLTKENAEYKENTVLGSLSSLYFNVYLNYDLLFNGYFSASQEVLYKLAKPLYGSTLSGKAINAAIILEELGKKLTEYSGRPGESEFIFTFTGPKVLETDKRLLSSLLRQPSARLQFEGPVGDFTLTLLAPNLEDSMNICANARVREFITMDKMDLIEPISYSALKVFSELLKLDIREKSVTHREKLIPRFEISVLLDIFFAEIEGKVILNLSKRLALKIYEILLEERVEEFNNEVKDAIAEITNMITGNAKSEFEKHGIYYKISTPLVLESRKNVIIYARNMEFLSSVYWTNEGFFDLSFSFFRK